MGPYFMFIDPLFFSVIKLFHRVETLWNILHWTKRFFFTCFIKSSLNFCLMGSLVFPSHQTEAGSTQLMGCRLCIIKTAVSLQHVCVSRIRLFLQLLSCLLACLALMAFWFCVTVDSDDPVMLVVSTISMSLHVRHATSFWRDALRAKKNSWDAPARTAPSTGPIQYTWGQVKERSEVTAASWSADPPRLRVRRRYGQLSYLETSGGAIFHMTRAASIIHLFFTSSVDTDVHFEALSPSGSPRIQWWWLGPENVQGSCFHQRTAPDRQTQVWLFICRNKQDFWYCKSRRQQSLQRSFGMDDCLLQSWAVTQTNQSICPMSLSIHLSNVNNIPGIRVLQ